MKTIINDRMYDTETATLIAQRDDGAQLYETRKGRLFAVADGQIAPVADRGEFERRSSPPAKPNRGRKSR